MKLVLAQQAIVAGDILLVVLAIAAVAIFVAATVFLAILLKRNVLASKPAVEQSPEVLRRIADLEASVQNQILSDKAVEVAQ